MGLEIEDTRSKAAAAEPQLQLIDFYSFHQGSLNMSDNSASNKQPGNSTIEMNDPFAFHQGLSALTTALNKPGQSSGEASRAADDKKEPGSGQPPTDKAAPGAKPENIICVDGMCRPMTPAEIAAEAKRRGEKPAAGGASDLMLPNPFKFHQNDSSPFGPAKKPELPNSPKDTPTAPTTDATAQPGDKPAPANIPGSPTGKSSIVEAYERRQGARIAGSNSLPPIDAIPSNLRPPQPGDLNPPQPGPGNKPWEAPKPGDVTPWVPPFKVDNEVKPADFVTPAPRDNTPDPADARVKHVDNMADFEREVLNSKVPVIVDFYATWCGPCKQLAPNLEQTAQDYGGKVKVVKIDAERARDVASKYGISSYPTMITFNNGQKVERTSGYKSVSGLHQMADKMLR